MMSEGAAMQESSLAALAKERQGLRVGEKEEEERRAEEEGEEEGEEGREEEGEGGERRMKVERRDGPVTLRLLDASLWQAFKREGTEMIITKAGRRMFPFVMVKLEGLSPTLLYSVHLSLLPCDHRQYKFCQRRWVKVSDATPGPTSTPDQAYTHPASPNRGSFWCQEMISFAKLKITNNKHSQGDIVLQSMRKYMAQITVREDLGDAEYVFQLPETTFVAVTQYQNEAVTRMKIAHNPFANGFKYAHVTGTSDGKKLFSKSDSRQKQTSASSTKTGTTKTARVKATIPRQSLTPVILNPHNPENLRLVSSALSLSGAPQSLYFSPTLTLEAEADPGPCLSLPQVIQGGFQVPSSAAVSPYIFRSEEGEEESPEREVSLNVESFKLGMRSPPEDAQDKESILEEETLDEEDVMNSASPTVLSTRTLPTTVTDSEETAGDASLELRVSESEDVHAPQVSSLTSPKSGLSGVLDACSSGTPTNLSKKRGGLFKQPHTLPRKGSSSAKKAGQRGCAGELTAEEESSASASAACASSAGVAVDADPDWGRIASHKSQRGKDWAVKQDRGVQVKLHDSHIWHSFAACGSKMIVSAEGRNMFPIISISLRGLDPGRLYSVWLHVTPSDTDLTCSSQGHEPTLCGPLQSGASRRSLFTASSARPYMHPSSPMRGLAWMKVKVDFSEVKLTTLTSDSAPVLKDCLPLQCGRHHLTQIVVREEEEVTPNGTGLMGNIYFFPLQEVTFVAKLESDECKLLLPVTSSENGFSETGKRCRDSGENYLDTTSEELDVSIPPPSKLTRVDVGGGQWMKSPILLPRQADLAPLLSRSADLSSLLSRQHDLCNRINPLYCFPPFSTLPPAHVGCLPNRMPYPVTSPLQSIASFPFPSQLFQQLRSPMHTAFGMSLPSTVNPFPYCYYPYPLSPQVTVASSATSEANKGLDLSLKSSESL